MRGIAVLCQNVSGIPVSARRTAETWLEHLDGVNLLRAPFHDPQVFQPHGDPQLELSEHPDGLWSESLCRACRDY